MVRTRGGHTDSSASREARPSTSTPQDPFQASQALTVPSSEGRVPSSPPQRRYSTRRPPTSPLPKPSIVELSHFTLNSTSTWRLCDSSRTFGIRLDCSRGHPESTAIRFSIDGCQGILEARHIA
ncbi:hypothetical protein CK203_113239 [Vitis vinifera]|uniref:Uncharacterized protein n=1 Tax=Vitis vinifera TaxID=29760 RepID=A0A438CC73_VITVI|nr:hypothetical protein CK203_113239 [Vitis vinifera]